VLEPRANAKARTEYFSNFFIPRPFQGLAAGTECNVRKRKSGLPDFQQPNPVASAKQVFQFLPVTVARPSGPVAPCLSNFSLP
jgi:hypothetical protein